jgi:hypothetical protein
MATKPGPILALAGLAALFLLGKGGGEDGVPEGGLLPDPLPGGGGDNTSSGGKKVPKGTGTGGSDFMPTKPQGPADLWFPPDCKGAPFIGDEWLDATFVPWVMAEGVHTFIPAGDDPNAPAGTVIQGRQSAILTADQVIALFFQIRELVPQVQASGTLSGLPQRADGSSVYLTDIKSDLPKPYSCLAESPFFKWSSPVSEGGYDLDLANEDRFRRDMVAWGAKYPFLYAFLWWLQDQMRGNPELEARYQDLGVSTTDRVFAPMPALGEMTVIEEPLPNPDAGKDAHEGPVSADPDQWWADFSAWAQKAKNQATGEARRGVQVIEGATRAWYNQIPEFFKKMPGLPASTTQTASGQVVSSDDPLINELITRYGPALGFLWAARPMKENFKALKEWVTIYTDEAKQPSRRSKRLRRRRKSRSGSRPTTRWSDSVPNWKTGGRPRSPKWRRIDPWSTRTGARSFPTPPRCSSVAWSTKTAHRSKTRSWPCATAPKIRPMRRGTSP